MDLLRNHFSMHRAPSVASKTSSYFIDPEEQSSSVQDGSSEKSWSLRSRPDHYSDSISGSTLDSQTPPEEESLSQQKAEQIRRYLAGRFETGINEQFPNANLKFVLFSIRTLYTGGDFNASPTITKTRFWEDTDLAIYLMKASKRDKRGASRNQVRAFQFLKKSTADTTYTMSQGTATILIELLSPIHDLTQLVTKRLCALLRHSGDLSEALRVTRDGIRVIRALLGTGSL
ncbi:hypothetical protein TSTA_093470 [Talaromyces stipitatus ATCC 10500]|uniref:Uncharacterized protein n=1 Tax=Talaromyces stipitatus (strain ATCC 10500 / CBS 375.48 / QM 6759 / NRRL 1006) TaxID=441959 RepID=B8M1L4_TALSN|nr:uncharacterized protein TSTA_093470 [Talaromyces stipitatus ATCC 10500]EED22101.1 hypothetical protein TSTA_093470 [Talaromyces stipitatus ATCC 10500]